MRVDELRFATSNEFKEELWIIAAQRMKMSHDHIVPLTPKTLDLLNGLKSIAKDPEWVMPSALSTNPISQNALIFALYRMGYHSRATIHGLRSTFSTIANDSGLWTPDASKWHSLTSRKTRSEAPTTGPHISTSENAP